GTIDQVKNAGLALNTLWVNGQVKITDGTEGDGKVLTSNAAGVASWQAAQAGGAGGGSASLEYKTNTWTAWTFVLPQTINSGSVIKYNNSSYQEPIATCSVGKKVIGGGCAMILRYKPTFGPYSINITTDIDGYAIGAKLNKNFLTYSVSSGSVFYLQSLGQFTVYRSAPTSDGSGWVCGAGPTSITSGPSSTGPIDNTLYSLTATAICQ
ncbi:MAG: hypothetical protein WCT25_04540, partial [Candidatus Paceibacterota bacterium]